MISIHRSRSRISLLLPVVWGAKLSTSAGVQIDLLQKLRDPQRGDHPAITDPSQSIRLTYNQLDHESTKLALCLKDIVGSGRTIGVFNKPSTHFVISMLATWKLGKVFVPMCHTHSINELDHVITDSKIKTVLLSKEDDLSLEMQGKLRTSFVKTSDLIRNVDDNKMKTTDSIIHNNAKDDALIMYTSGTTGRPKGVVHTHSNLHHMMYSLIDAWQYQPSDKLLHFLPLYHMHGLLNKLLCVLNVGGCVEFSPSASPNVIWQRLSIDEDAQDPLTMFMAVPTVYAKMLEFSRTMDEKTKEKAIKTMKRMRFMACGSAALPDIVMDDWKRLTGQTLLERYGMTEIGMALSNPYQGERRKGHVGFPLPFVNCRIVDENNNFIEKADSPGELQISGPCVFKHYLNNEKATKESFTHDGWFKTGDIAEVTKDGYYKILGRNSSDIIKASGYKISALEIERELLSHPNVAEAAVVGVPDLQVGEIIVCVASFRNNPKDVKKEMDEYLADKLAKYKIPRYYFSVSSIPRNHLGKVNKKSLLKDLNISLPTFGK